MLRNREGAALQLANTLKGRKLFRPLILAIPRGGVVTGVVLAQELDAELDVVLSRKLGAPGQSELAIGAVCENGQVFLNHFARDFLELDDEYVKEESRYQLAEIERRKKLFRESRPAALITGRSVIVTDDGIATGSTMIAALQTVKQQNPRELIVAVPVISPDRISEIRHWCDDLLYLLAPEGIWAIGQFYEDFSQVHDVEAVTLIRQASSFTAASQNARPENGQQGRSRRSSRPVHV
jgi:predicted phosphoribosyltransferase